MEYLSNEDIEFLSSQSQGKLNMVLVGMTNIMEDTQNKIQLMETQPWYKRMANTLTGKNKMTAEEIAKNHDKINVYMSEAISELYNRNCIDQNIILGLGNKLNELYASHLELKQMLGAFVNKLNQKITSIDNFHMLTTEINQGVYSNTVPIVALCKIMAQLDMRTVQDQRKMDILIRAVQDAGIVSQSEELFSDFLVNLLNISDSEAGIISFMLDNIQDNYLAEVTYDVVCEYYLLPENVRKMKNRSAVVKSVLEKKQIDLEYRVSTQEFYENLIDSISNNIIQYALAEEKANLKEKYEKLKKYLDDCVEFIDCLYKAKTSWKPVHAEFNTEQGIRTYHKFISNLYDCLNANSPLGNNIKLNAFNIGVFFQSAVNLYPQIKIQSFHYGDFPVSITDNGAVNIEYKELNFTEKKPPFGTFVEESFLSALKNLQSTCNSLGDELAYDPFSLNYMLNCLGNNPGIYSFYDHDSFGDNGFPIFYQYSKIIRDRIRKMINGEYEKYEELYNLTEKYPIEFDKKIYESNLCLVWDDTKPYVTAELQNGENWNLNFEEKMGEASFTSSMSELYKKYDILIKVENVDHFTLSYEILNNVSFDMSDIWNSGMQECKAFDVEWGDWIGNNLCELHITRLVEDSLASLKIKIYIKEMPDCYIIIT